MKYSALIGNPVNHSISPKLFQMIMDKKRCEYAHIKINIKKEDLQKKIDELFDLGFCGINITCPYKIDAYDLIDVYENGSDEIHSINTIYKKNGKIHGCNTDGIAAIKSINRELIITKNTKVVMFGAGGAAYSLLYELSKYTDKIIIINQLIKEIDKMLNSLQKEYKYYDLKSKEEYFIDLDNADLIINATSVGMNPNNDSIIDYKTIKRLSKNKVYFDVVFNPWETTFLKYAKSQNERIVSGGYMLINQALLALEKWTLEHTEIDEKEMQSIVRKLKKELKRLYD